jgi:hypothetical protein
MNDILTRIASLKKELSEFETTEPGKVFNSKSYECVKIKWLKLCIFEDEFHSIISSIRCLPGIASTVIINVNHTECIQILNTLLILISNVNVLKHLEEFNKERSDCENNPEFPGNDILYASQSFKMNRCKYQMSSYLSSLQEIIELYRKDIEQWLKNGTERSTRKSSMHM